MEPAQYWRANKNWSAWIGRQGTVLVSTVVRTSSPQQDSFKPFSYLLVDFGKEKKELLGVGHQEFQPGDKVVCVLRKISDPSSRELVTYGIKVKKLESKETKDH
ncbi:MAG: hypothetical protein A2383_04145 [Candidatus Pacebacteria bacterium RIFOXYB1_FULL_39_46]|nr:MAG: hypothetical protein A2383_04145 [Candidatus Pacebacteria bacterium RIFOXYB1_FULL_39_46]OGJ39146.1 MAG: hypothetical protein A2182_02390 [Candidatus Pacebacteria bacterium RIFOXYA1_FULL_38_18]OGJ40154.1 MAG: hypothetical protein A2582_03620 [Candidatus Pacebacteria bacterium RIFOXYD1_FULL_39_27]OGJ41039.1 MAG: hypothetical protein A2411_00970 [Candidatus Pacebacteria bacterium RIFOXYC1_FULL_39_21]